MELQQGQGALGPARRSSPVDGEIASSPCVRHCLEHSVCRASRRWAGSRPHQARRKNLLRGFFTQQSIDTLLKRSGEKPLAGWKRSWEEKCRLSCCDSTWEGLGLTSHGAERLRVLLQKGAARGVNGSPEQSRCPTPRRGGTARVPPATAGLRGAGWGETRAMLDGHGVLIPHPLPCQISGVSPT